MPSSVRRHYLCSGKELVSSLATRVKSQRVVRAWWKIDQKQVGVKKMTDYSRHYLPSCPVDNTLDSGENYLFLYFGCITHELSRWGANSMR